MREIKKRDRSRPIEPQEPSEEPETRLRVLEDPEAVQDRPEDIHEDPDRAELRIAAKQERAEAKRARQQAAREERERKKKMVTLLTLDYNQTSEEYLLAESRMTFDELPPGAVHVTGKKGTYFWDRVRANVPSSGITAADLNLWMINNSINDALAVNWQNNPQDIKKYLVYGIAAIVLVCVVWAMM